MLPELYDRISSLIAASDQDLERIERTLTDGYAHALTLEAEKSRLQKRIAELVHGLQRGDARGKTKELSSLAARLDGNAGQLDALRGRLTELRRHAEGVRVGSPVR